MASTKPFDQLDHPFTVTLEDTAKGTMDQSTGDFTVATSTTSTIDGHFQELILDEEGRQLGGLLETGTARFFTETTLEEDDVLRIHQDASGTNFLRFRVMGERRSHPTIFSFFGIRRHEYVLELLDPHTV